MKSEKRNSEKGKKKGGRKEAEKGKSRKEGRLPPYSFLSRRLWLLHCVFAEYQARVGRKQTTVD